MKTTGWSHFSTLAFQWGVVIVGYVAVGEWGSWLAPTRPWGLPLWFPAGFALFVATIWGSRIWPALFFAALLTSPFKQTTWLIWLGTSAADSAQAIFGAWLLIRFFKGRKAFDAAPTTLGFILLATPLIALVGTSATSLALAWEFSGSWFR
ncbi:MAG: hypothetical protein JNM63_00165, partial [Spirochaetia bacterium]|nr:hypothetical protein [Spirochaetia bacterium]